MLSCAAIWLNSAGSARPARSHSFAQPGDRAAAASCQRGHRDPAAGEQRNQGDHGRVPAVSPGVDHTVGHLIGRKAVRVDGRIGRLAIERQGSVSQERRRSPRSRPQRSRLAGRHNWSKPSRERVGLGREPCHEPMPPDASRFACLKITPPPVERTAPGCEHDSSPRTALPGHERGLAMLGEKSGDRGTCTALEDAVGVDELSTQPVRSRVPRSISPCLGTQSTPGRCPDSMRRTSPVSPELCRSSRSPLCASGPWAPPGLCNTETEARLDRQTYPHH